MKTAAVVFKRHKDAMLMAHMIERHVRQKKEWPSVNMFDFHLDGGPMSGGSPKLVMVRPWDFDNLRIYCAEAYLDMVTLSELNPSDDGFKISGELIKLDVPMKFYAEKLDMLWNI